jgi:hypothetical protein
MKHKVAIEVTGYVSSAFVQLEEMEIELSYDGDKTRKATQELQIKGDLDLLFKVRGWNGTDWTVAITMDDAENPAFKKAGRIEKKNYSLLRKSIAVT